MSSRPKVRLTDSLTGSLTLAAATDWETRPMTTRTQQRTTQRWVLPFLAALVAVLATILSAATASAATTGVAETRVRASSVVVEVPVGPPEHIAAGQRLGEEPARVVTVVATGVAANSEKFVYRGVARDHPGYEEALRGNAIPRNPNGATSAEAHNFGLPEDLADSPFTSWTRDPQIAAIHAKQEGVILRLPTGQPPAGSPWKFEWSPDQWFEQEVLVRGPVYGAERYR
jgi:hypothetical protein